MVTKCLAVSGAKIMQGYTRAIGMQNDEPLSVNLDRKRSNRFFLVDAGCLQKITRLRIVLEHTLLKRLTFSIADGPRSVPHT